jgi:hypothetical protein
MVKILIVYGVMFLSLLFAKEPTVMILDTIYSNGLYKFRYGLREVYCRPYGVWTVEVIAQSTTKNSVCKDQFKKFIASNPKLAYYAWYHLEVEQSYHIELAKDGYCKVFAFGQKTISEMLLQNGVAVLDPLFEDEEYSFRFQKSQNFAKYYKKGIWQNPLLKSCIVEFFKR